MSQILSNGSVSEPLIFGTLLSNKKNVPKEVDFWNITLWAISFELYPSKLYKLYYEQHGRILRAMLQTFLFRVPYI